MEAVDPAGVARVRGGVGRDDDARVSHADPRSRRELALRRSEVSGGLTGYERAEESLVFSRALRRGWP